MHEFFHNRDEWLLALIVFISLMLIAEASFRFGSKRISTHAETKDLIAGIHAEIRSVLALLLGFSFAMAVSRFDNRRALIVDEADAIGTAYLRARFVSEPHRSTIGDLLQKYVDLRLASAESGRSIAELSSIEAETARLQAQLWDLTLAATEQNKVNMPTLFVQSLNEVFHLRAKRIAALANHVPGSVIILLFVCAAIDIAGFGYSSGLHGRRVRHTIIALCLLVGVVMLFILDLDQPTRGWIRDSQESMTNVRASMQRASYR
jgi:hypothetical protein